MRWYWWLLLIVVAYYLLVRAHVLPLPPLRAGAYEGETVTIRESGTFWEGWVWQDGRWVKQVGI